ncbi:MAG TPA: hypothetical protein VFO85_22665, partial [Vicinamibacteria bacterium]|nr:hypothetical protein [Vicinamibacteria bacterium]
MRALTFIVSALLAGSAFAQAPASVYTPTGRDLSVPTFINATVVRVDARRNVITFRSESREISLSVEGAALAGLGRLRTGDQVILGYRQDDRGGRPVRIVTAILAGEEAAERGVVTATSATATPTEGTFSTISGRVVGSDRAAGTITISDAEGRMETLAVQGNALTSLRTVLPGDQVEVSFIPAGAGMVTGGVVGVGNVFGTVNTIQPVAPTFVTGAVTAFDSSTGALRLRTPFGDSMFTVPATGFDTGALQTGRVVRLDLGTRRGTTSVTGLSSLGGGTVTTGTAAATTGATRAT